jgi:hypothetical protein
VLFPKNPPYVLLVLQLIPRDLSNAKDLTEMLPENAKGRYSPAKCTGIKKTAKIGDPDEKLVSTSYAERQNLTMRMHMRRFTRLTNAIAIWWRSIPSGITSSAVIRR